MLQSGGLHLLKFLKHTISDFVFIPLNSGQPETLRFVLICGMPSHWSPQGPRYPACRGERSGQRPHSAGGCGSAGSPGAARLAAQESCQ